MFATLNGVFIPITIDRTVEPGLVAVAIGMANTGWIGGYLMRSPVSGMLIAATGADRASTLAPYRAAVFHDGGVALASAVFVIIARSRMDTKLIKEIYR